MSAKDEEIKIRVPSAMKRAIKTLADKRFTSESEIAREALLEYLRSRGIGLSPTEEVNSSQKAANEKAVLDTIASGVKKPKRKKKGAVVSHEE